MLAVEKWAKDKPFLLALIAPQMTATVRDVHHYLHDIRNRKIFNQSSIFPSLPSWFALYRSHHKTNNFLRTLIGDFSSFGQKSIDTGDAIVEGLQFISKGNPLPTECIPTAADMQSIQELFKSILDESFKELTEDFSGEPLDPLERDSALNFMGNNNIETSFFMLVYFPCILLYRTHPTRIYRAARLGCPQALEKLFRLDPLMLHDPALGKKVQSFRLNNATTIYEKLLEAARKAPKEKTTAKKMKYSIAGFISALASLIKFQLTEPEIRSLFDSVAQDAYGNEIDTDLADSPEAFSRAILRDRTMWLNILNPDMKN
ncbi:MAG: hypothetical protein AB9919_13090 [Geobacteraceae bacterium]